MKDFVRSAPKARIGSPRIRHAAAGETQKWADIEQAGVALD
jgi:hypothetical protein